jgi:hypothetical protein
VLPLPLCLWLNLTVTQSDCAIGKFFPSRIVADDNHCSSILIDLAAEDLTDIPPRFGI